MTSYEILELVLIQLDLLLNLKTSEEFLLLLKHWPNSRTKRNAEISPTRIIPQNAEVSPSRTIPQNGKAFPTGIVHWKMDGCCNQGKPNLWEHEWCTCLVSKSIWAIDHVIIKGKTPKSHNFPLLAEPTQTSLLVINMASIFMICIGLLLVLN